MELVIHSPDQLCERTYSFIGQKTPESHLMSNETAEKRQVLRWLRTFEMNAALNVLKHL